MPVRDERRAGIGPAQRPAVYMLAWRSARAHLEGPFVQADCPHANMGLHAGARDETLVGRLAAEQRARPQKGGLICPDMRMEATTPASVGGNVPASPDSDPEAKYCRRRTPLSAIDTKNRDCPATANCSPRYISSRNMPSHPPTQYLPHACRQSDRLQTWRGPGPYV
jgi:hypothetical protein